MADVVDLFTSVGRLRELFCLENGNDDMDLSDSRLDWECDVLHTIGDVEG